MSANSPFSNHGGRAGGASACGSFDLRATILSATSIRLNWTDNANNETGFQVWRSVNDGGSALLTTLAANTVTYTDGSVTAGNTYAYQVQGHQRGGRVGLRGPVTWRWRFPQLPVA